MDWPRLLSSTIYDWTLGQILPRCREEGCQQKLTESSVKENTGLQGLTGVQGLTEDPGELTPVLGLATDCSAQSDCRGCLEDSTRVHRPGNWTGGEKGARIPRWGGIVQQAWHRPVLPAHYLLPNTREETGFQHAEDAFVDDSLDWLKCRPARSSADVHQRGAVRQRMKGGNTPSGVSSHPQGARLALRLVRQGDGLHYPVGQPLIGDSLPFLLTFVEDKELLRASEHSCGMCTSLSDGLYHCRW